MKKREIISTVISTVIIFALIILSAVMTACQPTQLKEKYNHIKVTYENMYFNINPQNIVELVFAEDGLLVHYNNIDQFDYENLRNITHRKYWFTTSFGTPCIPVQIDDSISVEFITDMLNYKDTPNFAIKDKYLIVEQYIPEVNDFLWYIEKAENIK